MKHKFAYAKWILFGVVATAVLTACTATNNPTPQAPLAEVVTVSVERPSATATPPPSSTPTVTRILVETAVPTSTPKPTSTVQPITPTSTVIAEPVWNEALVEVGTLDANIFIWSPTRNEALVSRCAHPWFYDIDPAQTYVGYIFTPELSVMPLFPETIVCNTSSDFAISPDGQTAVYFTLANADDGSQSASFWVTDLRTQSTHTFSLEYPLDVQIDGWITNDVLYYSFYSGGGHIHTIALNAKNGNEGQYGKVHGLFFDANFGFIAATDGMSLDARASAAVLTDTENEYGHQLESGPNVNILSRRYSETGFEQLFNSRYEDWHPNSPRMLVATWDSEIDLWNVDLLHEPAAIDLQLWDLETNELSLVVPRAVYGRFSSDGRLLLYLTSAPDYPIAHLYDWQNQQMIVEQPVIAFRESGYPIEFEMSFSPDGRFLTYFTPNEDGTTTLQIINSAVGETVWQIANPVTQMTWSPTSEAFIYRDAEGNLAFFTVADGNSQPLTFEGGRLLTNPQWSYDGRYLSVSVQNETGGETAVLTFTNRP